MYSKILSEKLKEIWKNCKAFILKKTKKCKAPWDGTHKIIYLEKKRYLLPTFHVLINGQTITYKLSITENFTIFVCQLKKTIENKIYPPKRDYC